MYKKNQVIKKSITTFLSQALITFLLLTLPWVAMAQGQSVQIDIDRPTIDQTFKQIEVQTGLRFAYDVNFDLSRRVELPKSSTTLGAIMDVVLQGTDRSYVVVGETVLVQLPKPQQAQPIITEKPVRIIESLPLSTMTLPTQSEQSVVEVSIIETATDSVPAHEQIEQVVVDNINIEYLQVPLLKRVKSPRFAVKTNLLYGAITSPNLGVEFKLSNRTTLDIPVSFNNWTFSDNTKMKHILVQPEYRYWFCEPFYKYFVGVNATYAFYNVGGVELPFSIFSKLKETRYEGNLAGVGISSGYNVFLGPRWGLEATLGLGYVYARYKEFECRTCGNYKGIKDAHYFGPTKIGLSLVYIIK